MKDKSGDDKNEDKPEYFQQGHNLYVRDKSGIRSAGMKATESVSGMAQLKTQLNKNNKPVGEIEKSVNDVGTSIRDKTRYLLDKLGNPVKENG